MSTREKNLLSAIRAVNEYGDLWERWARAMCDRSGKVPGLSSAESDRMLKLERLMGEIESVAGN